MTWQLVVGAVLVDDLEAPTVLLAARRTSPSELAGRWELPGGKVEAGETPQDALRRELREELGIGVRLGREVPGPDDGHWPISGQLRLRVWFAQATSGEPTPDGSHDEVRWLSVGACDGADWLAADRPIVDQLTCDGCFA